MTGLDKIIKEIQDEASAEAAAMIAKAKAEAEKILANAKAESDAKCEKIAAAAAQDVADIAQSRESAIALQRRQRALQTKQEMLSETLDKALESLKDLPETEYFGLMVHLASTSAQPGEGVMMLSENDSKRVPADFAQKVAAALPSGSTITISSETRPIDGGFILKYGDIEENCSFKSIFDASRDDFSDAIRDTLFS